MLLILLQFACTLTDTLDTSIPIVDTATGVTGLTAVTGATAATGVTGTTGDTGDEETNLPPTGDTAATP